METHGRYILIGAFTVLGFVGMVVFLLWFGASQANRQFARYDVLFDSVSGITRSSEVRFAGLPVGQVQSLELDPQGSGKVRVQLEVDANTPIRTDSVATLETQGVTGTSVVAISAGHQGSALLQEAVAGIPEIPAGRSALQNLSESAPAVLDEALKAIEQINAILSPANSEHVGSIISNLDTASGQLASTLTAADEAMANIGGAVDSLSRLTTVFDSLSGKAGVVLDSADSAIHDFASLKDRTSATIDSANRLMDTAERALDTEVKPALSDIAQTAAQLRETVDRLAPRAESLMTTWVATGEKASARLDETQGLITSLRRTADAIDGETTERLNKALDQLATDLPMMSSDLRNASQKASEAFTSLGTLVSSADKPLNNFLRTGLPEFTRLAGDIRGLVSSLTSLTNNLRRNPAGTLLRNDMPEFRR